MSPFRRRWTKNASLFARRAADAFPGESSNRRVRRDRRTDGAGKICISLSCFSSPLCSVSSVFSVVKSLVVDFSRCDLCS
jgi:hypothetical protein